MQDLKKDYLISCKILKRLSNSNIMQDSLCQLRSLVVSFIIIKDNDRRERLVFCFMFIWFLNVKIREILDLDSLLIFDGLVGCICTSEAYKTFSLCSQCVAAYLCVLLKPWRHSHCVLNVWQLGSHGSNLTEEELETHTISAWKEAKLYLNIQLNGPGSAVSRRLVQVSLSMDMLHVCR